MLQQDTVRFSTFVYLTTQLFYLYSLSYFGFPSFGCFVSCECFDLSDTTVLFSCKYVMEVTFPV